MCLEHLNKLSPFPRMVVYVVLGLLTGIIVGLGASLLIAFIARQFEPAFARQEFYRGVSFMGMGLGALVGAMMGYGVYNKKD